MKRIISLILTVIMAAGLLVSCGYSLADDNMSKYADFDKNAFIAGCLNRLKIEDADFTADAQTRAKKLSDAFYAELKALAEEKKENGTLGEYDVLYYCYYVTAEKDGKSYIFSTDKMDMSKPSSTQVGLKDLDKVVVDGLDTGKAPQLDPVDLWEKLEGFEFETVKTDNKVTGGKNFYTVSSTDKPAAGDMISVTYTLEYTPNDPADAKLVKETHTSEIIVLDANDPFHAELIKLVAGEEKKDPINVTDTTTKSGRKYSKVKINWIKVAGEERLYENKVTYKKDKTLTATNGDKVQVKDLPLTYHIYPVYFDDVPTEADLDWKKLVTDVMGTDVNAALIDCFWDENNKEADSVSGATTLRELVNGDGDKLDSLATLISTEKNISTDLDDKDKKAEAEKKKAEAKKALDERMNRIAAVVEAKGLKDDIVEDYKQYLYNTMVYEYNNEIKGKLAKEINSYIEKNVVIKDNGNKLPKKLVNEVYDILMQNHKSDFYEGETSDGKTTNYAANDGSFEKYLIKTKSTEGSTLTFKQAKEKVKDDAKTFVTYLVKLQAVAEAYDCVITDKDYKELNYDNANSSSYISSYGDIGLRASYQFEELFDKLLKYQDEDKELKAYNNQLKAAEKDESKTPRYSFEFGFAIDMDKTVIETGSLPFENLIYKIEEKSTETK